jgi:hypothetical protein
MRLRAPKARSSVLAMLLSNQRLVRAMTYRMYGTFIASLGAIALMLAANETFAASGIGHRGGFTSTHSISHRSVAQSLRRFRRRNAAIVWPAVGDDFYGSSYGYGSSHGEPGADITQPTSGDVHYTNTYDVPWDWAHRFPPNVAPSERPYVPSCPTENVTVPGHNGKEQTVSVMRCF